MKALYARRVFRNYTKRGTFYAYPDTLVAAPVEAFTVEYFDCPPFFRHLSPIPAWWSDAGLELPTKNLYLPHDGTCKHCGTRFLARDLRVHYCSGDCMAAVKAKQARDRYAKRGSRYTPVVHTPIPCVVCGTAFTPLRSDARTCSVKCRVALHRRKSG